MRDGKSGLEGGRQSSGHRNTQSRYLREVPEEWNPQQEAKDARRSARERAQLWKTIKSEH